MWITKLYSLLILLVLSRYKLERLNESRWHCARGERLAGLSWLTMHFIWSVLLCSSVRSTTEQRKKNRRLFISFFLSVSRANTVNMNVPPLDVLLLVRLWLIRWVTACKTLVRLLTEDFEPNLKTSHWRVPASNYTTVCISLSFVGKSSDISLPAKESCVLWCDYIAFVNRQDSLLSEMHN
jgi:hypothetical protein